MWTIRELYVRTIEKLADVGGRSKAEQAMDEFCNAPKLKVSIIEKRRSSGDLGSPLSLRSPQ